MWKYSEPKTYHLTKYFLFIFAFFVPALIIVACDLLSFIITYDKFDLEHNLEQTNTQTNKQNKQTKKDVKQELLKSIKESDDEYDPNLNEMGENVRISNYAVTVIK